MTSADDSRAAAARYAARAAELLENSSTARAGVGYALLAVQADLAGRRGAGDEPRASRNTWLIRVRNIVARRPRIRGDLAGGPAGVTS